MKSMIVALTLVALFSTGCIKPSYKSLNAQRSAIRGGGDIGVTIALDTVDTGEEALLIAAETKKIAIEIDNFLKSGDVGSLTTPVVTTSVRKLVPEDYSFLYDMVISQVSGVSLTVAVDIIGSNNVKRMRALCAGIINGCDSYVATDRAAPDASVAALKTPTISSAAAVPALTAKGLKPSIASADIKKFGQNLKIEMQRNTRK